MLIDPQDYMDRQFYLGTYASSLVRLIQTVVKQGDVCVDVGAQKGYVTLHLASTVGPAGQVLAFEPDARAMDLLLSHVRRNHFSQVKLYDCGLGQREGVCDFVLSTQLGWSSRFPNTIARPAIASTTKVTLRTLDDVIAEAGIEPQTNRLSFIKIDAEGAEPQILLGATETLRRFSPTLHIEINKDSLRSSSSSARSIDILLRSLDYHLYTIEYRRSGWLLRRRVSLIEVQDLEADTRDCEDVLAVSPNSKMRHSICTFVSTRR